MKSIVVIGGGFAGLWSAAGAARKLDELNISADEVKITLIDQNDFHSIRVRNYERARLEHKAISYALTFHRKKALDNKGLI